VSERRADSADPLVQVLDLRKHFPAGGGVFPRRASMVKAVDGISFEISRGETLGLVGESGCGKTTAGRTLLQLYRPTSGSVLFHGVDLTRQKGVALRRIRQRIQMIFQDPFASLNPRWTVARIIAEPLRVHHLLPEREHAGRVEELLGLVGLDRMFFNRYPHECSGGQRQRVGVARALASRPDFIVCDEPISALDVSIRAQVVNLLEDLQQELGLTYLFIAHDLAMVRHICNRVAVMYLGVLAELAPRNELYEHPLHPYTRALLSAVSLPDPVLTRSRPRIYLAGELPSALNPPSGCRFHPRCPQAMPRCKLETPAWHEVGPGHWLACHLEPQP
jgi:oligopeptide transport system ATP-binding protein